MTNCKTSCMFKFHSDFLRTKAKLDTEAPSCTLTRCNQALEKQLKSIHVCFVVSPAQPQSSAKHAAVTAWHLGFFPCVCRRWCERCSSTRILNAHAGADLWASESWDWGTRCCVGPEPFLFSLFSAATPALSFAALSPAALSGCPSCSSSVQSARQRRGVTGHRLLTGPLG